RGVEEGEAASAAARELRPDVVLMDIMLKGPMSGIEAAMAIRGLPLKDGLGIPVVFLTAYSDPATLSRARVAEPYGYIVKPCKALDVQTAVQLAVHKHAQEAELLRERDKLHELAASGSGARWIFLRHEGRQQRVALRDIYFLAALKDYTAVHLQGRRYVVHGTLKHFEERLPAEQFMRIHRSFIVRIDRIAAIDPPHAILEDDKGSIPIGDSYYGSLIRRLELK
ncbi:MAG: LytR/AlgR family response regulator transcription factor, partial [Flavobacteriales bacterium]